MAKFAKCPECGKGFKLPAVDQKRIGIGFTIPGLGTVECPHCHHKGSRKSYPLTTPEEIEAQAQEQSVLQAKKEETDSISDSKFERD